MAEDDALEQYKNQFPPKPSQTKEPHEHGAEDAEPDDDAEAEVVAKVQRTCQIAAMSAGSQDNPNERRRFEKRIASALDLAKSIRDEFYRSSAFHQVISTLLKDKQLDRAEELADEVTVDIILERVHEELRTARGDA